MNALVVGAGEMGRWIGELAGSLEAVDEVGFADRDASTAEAAAGDATAASRAVPLQTDEPFDVVCVAVPIPVAAETVRTFADRATTAIVDVTGTMADPVAAMRETAPDCERLSLHPLFAPPNEPGNVAAVHDQAGPITDELCDVLEARENTLYRTTPTEHDEAMETVQARTHAAVLAYALAAEDVPKELHTPVSAGLDGLVEQVTGGEGRVYADIQAAFEGAEDVAASARALADADADSFLDLYEDAGR